MAVDVAKELAEDGIRAIWNFAHVDLDVDDEKVLYSAIIADVDILLTGDKDFSDIEIEKPEILTPGAFLEKY